MKVTTVGSGYVGLVTGACLAHIGHEVIAADIDKEKISLLNKGSVPIYEPGLEELMQATTRDGRLRFSADVAKSVAWADIVFISVGTPSAADGSADLRYVKDVAKVVGQVLDRYKVIVNKSTVPVGTTKVVAQIIQENLTTPRNYDVVSNPEFLREGSAIEDFLHPDRIVIGSDSEKAAGLMAELYKPIKAPLVITDAASAEMIKYASNAFLATKISFINAIANICDAVGADVKEVAIGMGYDKRIGFDFLKPGPGFGGSCFPKDCRALIKIAETNGYNFQLLKGVLAVNEEQKKIIAQNVCRLVGDVSSAQITVLGLAFKPNTDDMREAPALEIIKELQEKGVQNIKVYDPVAMENAKKLIKNIKFMPDAYTAVKGADIVVLLTEWEEFKSLNWRQIKAELKQPVILDARNCLDPQVLRRLGYTYQGVGR